jgi:hypothetical protein
MKRKRSAKKQAADAVAAKRAAIAAEVALGPIPTRLLLFGMLGPFAPWRMREGLFDSDKPGEVWAAHPDYAPSEALAVMRAYCTRLNMRMDTKLELAI